MMWRLAAASRFPRNARVQHLPSTWDGKRPRCGTHGEYRRVHFAYAEDLDLPPCPGCFEGENLHDNRTSRPRTEVTA